MNCLYCFASRKTLHLAQDAPPRARRSTSRSALHLALRAPPRAPRSTSRKTLHLGEVFVTRNRTDVM